MAGRYIYTPTCAYGLDRSVCIVREGAAGRAGPDFFEAQGETIIRGPLYIRDIDNTKCKYIIYKHLTADAIAIFI